VQRLVGLYYFLVFLHVIAFPLGSFMVIPKLGIETVFPWFKEFSR
jgi:hypothetical protein